MTTAELIGRIDGMHKQTAGGACDWVARTCRDLAKDIDENGIADASRPRGETTFSRLLDVFVASGVEVVLPGPEGVRVPLSAVMDGLRLAARAVDESDGAKS